MATQPNERTLKLTHEQIELIVSALKMANRELYRTFEELGNKYSYADKEQKMYWYNLSNQYYDLQVDIGNGNFDV